MHVNTRNTICLLVGKYLYVCYRRLHLRLAMLPGFHVTHIHPEGDPFKDRIPAMSTASLGTGFESHCCMSWYK